MSRNRFPKKKCNTCKHVIDINENQYGQGYITCECDKCEYEALMNAREILEALLDGKMVVDRSPEKREICYRLNGDNIEYKSWVGWNVMCIIPSISLECSSIEGKGEKWKVRGRMGKKMHRRLKL